ncbi:MAG: fibronectin type III domain-containing protein [Bacteroidota bacterium]
MKNNFHNTPIIYCTILFFVLSFLCPLALSGQTFIVQPYLQDLGQNEVTIMWETDIEDLGSVFWGTGPFDLNNESTSVSIVGSGTSRIHTSILPLLDPATKYYYRVVMDGGAQSRMYTFKTLELPSAEQNSQFIAMSDMQRDGSKPDKFREIVEEGVIPIVYSEIGDSLYDLEGILIPGDLVVTGGNYAQWKDHFFSKADSITPNVPLYPVPGNHEYFGGGLPNFKKYFSLPNNGSIIEECWYKDISNVRIIGLNSNSGSADQNTQLNWLSEVLDSTCDDAFIDFVFAELHHPYKSELWTPGESSFTEKVVDSLEQFTSTCGKASIHFFGHTHGYSRGQSRDHKHLWINVATAGGAIDNWGEFPNADYEEFVKSQDEYGFVLIDVVAGDDPTFTIKRYGRGDQDVIQDNVLRDSLTVLNNDIAPQTPLAIFPAGDTILPYCITLKASDFYGEEDTHQASHWQVAEGSNFTDNLLTESWAQNENFYNEINTQSNDDLTDQSFQNINSSDTLFWRVRYRNQNLEWSEWSVPVFFFLGGNIDTLSSNLVMNGGAENDIQNWEGDIEALELGECNSVLPFEDDFNFGVGGICQNESDEGIASQMIDLTSFQSNIETGKISLSFGAYMRNFSGSDVPEIYVELIDKDIVVETSAVLSNTTSTWTEQNQILIVPEEVDSCRIILKGTRNAGSDNDSYFDKIYAYLIDVEDCPICFGSQFIDSDADGFCSDIDCNDGDGTINPAALELCNGIDDNCDGIADSGNTVMWTGAGGNSSWSNPLNWNQQMVPLPCQHVIIDNTSSVVVNAAFECLSLELAASNQLEISTEGTLIINGQNVNGNPSCNINGTMIINGRCDLKNSQVKGFEVGGILINNNKINIEKINLQSITLSSGGRFDNLGKTVLK